MVEDPSRIRDAQRHIIERQYALWIKKHRPANSPISFYEEVKIDDYFTITLGEWGGYYVQILPMIFNDRLVLTPINCPGVYDYGWCFDKGRAAFLSALVWDPETEAEPAGYKKRAMGIRQAGERAAAVPVGAEHAAALMLAVGMPPDEVAGLLAGP